MPLLPLVGLFFAVPQAAQPTAVDPITKVSFSEPAAPLSRLIPELAKATNMPLRYSKAMPNFVMDIAVKDVSVKDLMAKIAEASGGFWEESEHALYLSPSEGARAKIAAEAQKERVVSLSESLSKIAKAHPDTQPKPGVPLDYAAYMYGHTDPLFLKALTAIGAEKLATMLQGDRVVLSTQPLARQYQLPLSNEDIAAFVLRRNAAAAERAAKRGGAYQGADSGSAAGDTVMDVPDVPFGPATQIGAWTKADLVLSKSSTAFDFFGANGITCELKLFDGKGALVGSDQMTLPDTRSGAMMQAMMDQVGPDGKPKKQEPSKEPDIELSTDTKLFLATVMNASGGSGFGVKFPKPTAEQKAMVRNHSLHPDQYEPLTFTGELLTGMAKAKNIQLVACLPDTSFMYIFFAMTGQSTPSRVQTQLLQDGEVVCRNTDGWLTVSPSDTRVNPISRDDLAKLSQDVTAGTKLNFEWQTNAATIGLGDYFRGPLGVLWVELFSQMFTDQSNGGGDPGSNPMAMGMSDWDFLHLYGELDQNQREMLAKNGKLPISSLSEDSKALVDRIIYSASSMWSRLNVEVKVDKNSLFSGAEEVLQEQSQEYIDGQMANDYRSEPTEVAPNGLPSEATITLKQTTDQVLIPVYAKLANGQPNFMSSSMGVEELADYVAMVESPNYAANFGGQYTPPKIIGVKLGVKHVLHFRIWVAADTFKTTTAEDTSALDDKVYGLNQLPGDLQEKYNKAKADAVEMYKDMKQTDVNSTVATGGNGGVPR